MNTKFSSRTDESLVQRKTVPIDAQRIRLFRTTRVYRTLTLNQAEPVCFREHPAASSITRAGFICMVARDTVVAGGEGNKTGLGKQRLGRRTKVYNVMFQNQRCSKASAKSSTAVQLRQLLLQIVPQAPLLKPERHDRFSTVNMNVHQVKMFVLKPPFLLHPRTFSNRL